MEIPKMKEPQAPYITQHKQLMRAKFTGMPATDRSRYQILFIHEGQANTYTDLGKHLHSAKACPGA